LQIKIVITPERGKGIWTNNATIYGEQPFQQEFTERWTKWQTLHPILFVHKPEWWMHIKLRIKDMNQTYARRQAHQRKNEEKDLEKALREVWETLPQKPELLPKLYSIKNTTRTNPITENEGKSIQRASNRQRKFRLGLEGVFRVVLQKKNQYKN